MNKVLPTSFDAPNSWFSQPEPDHLVHFYPYDSALSSSLQAYIGDGLRHGDTCVIIATKRHIAQLEQALDDQGLELAAFRQIGQYLSLDATELLAQFMDNDLPDWQRFLSAIEPVVLFTQQTNAPVRLFGEMVALLWQQNNLSGVLLLEKFWNRLASMHKFSLYCAYPLLHFDTSLHGEALAEISRHHDLVTQQP